MLSRRDNRLQLALRIPVATSNALPEDDKVALTITVQSEDNGAILRVTGLATSRVPVMESRFYAGRTVSESILPRHVTKLVSQGIGAGWTPQQQGSPFHIETTNADVFDSAK